ncbi:group 3 secretory phospholipase A2 [Bufo gargarizans]|uniref:group 3 secretory phospholipase A2 n=1 Tax=Bufo gargarizans TaxID=30331 RepID=UPI001CF1C5BD|nr:group 3 secretory phospholipase A2 [Bufo gargarizans]
MVWRSCIVVVVLFFIVLFTVNGEKIKTRYRRSWIMPGTLWCGAGSTAENFTSLGEFSRVDRCCREHDHCSPQIQAFEFQYGIRNYRLHTVSHCYCDQRFRQCLHALNDTVSTLVGIMFFNILEMPCFSLREEEQCVEWHWWGGCKKNGSVPKAELQKPEIFNYSEFSRVDRCCREHNHCSPQIQAFEFQYGIKNDRFHTVSHCDCDQRFRQCLHALNDTMSTLVGIMFFNILEMPCFSLREEEQCVEWHWWGGCKKNGSVPKAELQKPEIFNYSEFSRVDRCCREHDHCSPQIQAFEFQYGIRNYRLHTVSHCDCDQRFRQCLHALNDTVSTLVGIMFFNILEMPCFSLREEEQCVEWHWWGGCKKNGSVPKAELQKPEIFNYSNPEDRHTSIPIPHSLHPHNVTSPPQQWLNAKSRRRRLKRLQREPSKRDNKGILKDSNKAEAKSKILNVKSKLFTKH